MPDVNLSDSHRDSEMDTILISTFQVRKLRYRENDNLVKVIQLVSCRGRT